MGFIKTTDNQPNDPPSTFHLPTDPSNRRLAIINLP